MRKLMAVALILLAAACGGEASGTDEPSEADVKAAIASYDDTVAWPDRYAMLQDYCAMDESDLATTLTGKSLYDALNPGAQSYEIVYAGLDVLCPDNLAAATD